MAEQRGRQRKAAIRTSLSCGPRLDPIGETLAPQHHGITVGGAREDRFRLGQRQYRDHVVIVRGDFIDAADTADGTSRRQDVRCQADLVSDEQRWGHDLARSVGLPVLRIM